ncbi:DMT family transporter [Fundicoccus sp. Sow4_D5]|uniref:DMT family transporter n=1 Tax=unclassified Fundicoccus TaxID=2761543 RepID=UPI003F8FB401
MKKYYGTIILLGVAVIWGSGFVASALALNTYSPFQILALRFTLAFLILLASNISRLSVLTWSKWRQGGLIGLFLFLAFAFQTIGLQYTTASKNAFLTATNIVIIPFLTWFILKRPLSWNAVIGASITLGGIGLLSLNGSLNGINYGDVLTLICALFFALQIFYTEFFVKKLATWEIMFMQMGVAALLSWVMVAFEGDLALDLSLQALSPIIYLGLFSTLIAFGLQTYAQRFTTSNQASLILSTEAFFGMIAAVIILNEALTANLLIGAFFILLGILVVELKLFNFKQDYLSIDENIKD